MRYIVLALALCFAASGVDAKPRVTSHKVRAKKVKAKSHKSYKPRTVRRNKAN